MSTTVRASLIAVSVCLVLSAAPSLSIESPAAVSTFSKLYQNLYQGSTVYTSASDIYPTTDGGFVALGVTRSPTGYDVGWVVKLNATGSPQWSEELGGAFTYPASIEQTADGGYIVAGGTRAGSGSVCDPLEGAWCAWVVKLDAGGGVQWQRVYATGASSQQTAWEIRQGPDGGYAIIGNSGSTSNYGAWIAALDASGNVRWQKVFGGTSQYDLAEFESVQPTLDQGYVAAGWITAGYDSEGIYMLSAYVVKLDAGGRVQWQKQYSNFDGQGANIGGARAESIVQTPDGGYLVGGAWDNRTHPEGADFLLLKLDSSGGIQWQKAYDGGVQCFTGGTGAIICVRLGGFIYSVHPSADGGYLLSGFGHAVMGDQVAVEAWLAKVDSSGTFLWQNTYFPTYGPTGASLSSQVFYDAGTTADGGVVAIGTTNVYQTSQDNLYILKADASGNLPGCSEVHPGVPLTTINPSLVATVPSPPVSTAPASAAPAAGDALQTSVSVTQGCGGGTSPPPPMLTRGHKHKKGR